MRLKTVHRILYLPLTLLEAAALITFNNVLLLGYIASLPFTRALLWSALVLLAALAFHLYPVTGGRERRRWLSGLQCMLQAVICLAAEVVLFTLLWTGRIPFTFPVWLQTATLFLSFFHLWFLMINGAVRTTVFLAQTHVTLRLLIMFVWWIPVAGWVVLALLWRACSREQAVIVRKRLRSEARQGQQICKTKYPLLMVHGIFFRDSRFLNYWGRIPAELEKNGAVCFYGNQDSSTTVADCAAQLKRTLEQVLRDTGCEKVNIIAHSKGGLDSRWLISRLGAGAQVASLTTINTPHRGCRYAREIMQAIPQNVKSSIGKGYARVFGALGDKDPDLLAGLENLTDVDCERLNAQMPDDPRVYYQSVGSVMASRWAAPFPLNLGYSIIKPKEGDNDGLVALPSMPWGNFLGYVRPSGKYGISHGDMVDLARRDIGDFDVCEYYVQLVSELRKKGY